MSFLKASPIVEEYAGSSRSKSGDIQAAWVMFSQSKAIMLAVWTMTLVGSSAHGRGEQLTSIPSGVIAAEWNHDLRVVSPEGFGHVGGDKPRIGKSLSLLLHPLPARVIRLAVPKHKHRLDMPRDIPIELPHEPLNAVHVVEQPHPASHHSSLMPIVSLLPGARSPRGGAKSRTASFASCVLTVRLFTDSGAPFSPPDCGRGKS